MVEASNSFRAQAVGLYVCHGNDVASLSAVAMDSEVAGLRDFLGSKLYEFLQDDALDTCDWLLLEASDVYEASDVGTAPTLDRNRDRDARAS